MSSAADPDNDAPVEYPITDVLDLHAFAARDTKAAVEAYLEAASERGFHHVRIIHGKGIGVQREMVRKVLERSPLVAGFRTAPEEAGGWGATLVRLSKGPSGATC